MNTTTAPENTRVALNYRAGFALPVKAFIAQPVEGAAPLIGTPDDNVLPAGGLMLSGGQAGVGKTTFALDGAGQWEVRWREGARHRSATVATREEALALDEARRSRRRMGAFAPNDPSDELLIEHVRVWYDCEQDGWAKSTRLNRAHLLDKWIVPYLGEQRLKDLGQPQIRAWRSAIERAGAKTVTANRALGTLSACLGSAVKDGKLPYNPCSGVEKRREVVARPRVLTPFEVEQIRAAMPSQRDAVLVSLMAYAGLRPAEAFALEWRDVGNLLVVDRSFTYGEFRPTKTGSRRTVDIVQPLRDDIDALRATARTTNGVGSLVAPNRSGGPLDLRTWRRRIWNPACGRAGVSAAPYDCRHGYCSMLAHEGRSAPYIAAMMGHALTDTQRHYAHLIDDARIAPAVSMVDAIAAAREATVRTMYATTSRRHLRAVS
jgi:integrase